MGNVLKAVGNFASKVGSIAGKVADIGGKVLNVIQKPMEALTGPIKKLAGGLLDKLPFGLGKFIKPVAEKLIDNAGSWLSSNVLGGMGFLSKAAKTVKDVVGIAETVKNVSDKVGALTDSVAQGNFQKMMAFAQGQLVN
jgi:hypothetical protein